MKGDQIQVRHDMFIELLRDEFSMMIKRDPECVIPHTSAREDEFVLRKESNYLGFHAASQL